MEFLRLEIPTLAIDRLVISPKVNNVPVETLPPNLTGNGARYGITFDVEE